MLAGRVIIVKDRIAKIDFSGCHDMIVLNFGTILHHAVWYVNRIIPDPPVHDGLFDQTKNYYKADDLFNETDRLEISEDTFRRIVKELERFDLSKTGDDIKGLAFEQFLGNTFRGELGQFFTPRPLVDFMVNLLDPQEGELICDPAAGSDGFFQIVLAERLGHDNNTNRVDLIPANRGAITQSIPRARDFV
jgi:hypothetical protein